ncbi:hypothetical protein ACH5AI_25115 [Streptomyces collinus]|uniref:hypothetical protein n=1 Tax=Streptomyces collinus TaxID=42684 RepID=UPI003788F0C4
MVLLRHDRHSLRGWAQRLGEVFNTEERLERLYAVTSGWPWLVDGAHRLHAELGDADRVLSKLAGMLTDLSEARAFVEATGVQSDAALAAGYRALDKQFQGSTADTEDVVTAIDLRDQWGRRRRGSTVGLRLPRRHAGVRPGGSRTAAPGTAAPRVPVDRRVITSADSRRSTP